MNSAQTRRGNFFQKDGIPNSDSMKQSIKDHLSDRDSKYDQENIPNGHSGMKNGGTNKIPDTYVGYSNLPNQVFRRAVRRGFEFNIMVLGESGLGKSTFINTLFLTNIYDKEHPGPSLRRSGTVEVCSSSAILQEAGVSLKLTVIDTPGFGDSIDNTECWKPIVEYLDSRFDDYMSSESRVTRNPASISDKRVHACLYFIAPTGHRLKNLDIECLKRIQDKVNVIPVIGKADCLTPDEVKEFKKNILEDLNRHKIEVYDFPDAEKYAETKGDEKDMRLRRLRDRMPFAVVGANSYITNSAGTKVRARTYPWGTVEVENVEHNDFAILSYFLIHLQMQNLREVTHRQQYEKYRAAKLSGIAHDSHFTTHNGQDPMMAMENEKREHEAKLAKMKADMEAVFAQKVVEKSAKLREFDADLSDRASQMRIQLDAEESQLERERRAFEESKSIWEEQWREWDVAADIGGSSSANLGLGERVLSEVIKERSKTEKKRKGLF